MGVGDDDHRAVLLITITAFLIERDHCRTLCKFNPSFPRRRESSLARTIFWIPAFAGMTKMAINFRRDNRNETGERRNAPPEFNPCDG